MRKNATPSFYRSLQRARGPLAAVIALLLVAMSPQRLTSEVKARQASAAATVRVMPPDAAAFLADQRFDIRAEAPAGATGAVRVALDGQDITGWNGRSRLTSRAIDRPPAAPLAGGLVFISRDWSFPRPGRHTLRAEADGASPREVSFDIVEWRGGGRGVHNVILLIGDGMGTAQRTAARIVSRGLTEGRYGKGMLEMDEMQATGMVTTSSLSALVTDSAPGASCYATGNKGANNEEGVFPDNTDSDALKLTDPESDRFFDNPRVENLAEYMRRHAKLSNLGLVTTADVTDATPAAFAVHTSNRGASTRIADDYFDRREQTGLAVLLGGGRQWFEPKQDGKPGRRGTPSNPRVNTARDLIKEFRAARYDFADTADSLKKLGARKPARLLGLFAPSTMPVAFDKLGRGAEHFSDVPLLDKMARVALDSLSAHSPQGFFLMIEGASIDKQAHMMDADRAIWDTIEFDRAVGVAKRFAEKTNSDTDPSNDTLVIVTADHETGGFSLIGARNPDPRIPRGSRDQARAYRGFTDYGHANGDGYPDQADPPSKLIVGFGSGSDRYEDWVSNPRPLPPTELKEGRAVANRRRDGPDDADPSSRKGIHITGQVENGESAGLAAGLDIEPAVTAVHTAADIPLTASGPGAMQFVGVQDNTAVFFKMMRAYGGSFPRVYYDGGRPSQARGGGGRR